MVKEKEEKEKRGCDFTVDAHGLTLLEEKEKENTTGEKMSEKEKEMKENEKKESENARAQTNTGDLYVPRNIKVTVRKKERTREGSERKKEDAVAGDFSGPIREAMQIFTLRQAQKVKSACRILKGDGA